jgi:hypothetical protein
MKLNSEEVAALFKKQRMDESLEGESNPAFDELKPLRTFRKFIDDTRTQLGPNLNVLQEKEKQLIDLHRKTVMRIKEAGTLSTATIQFFNERRKDYLAMIEMVMFGIKHGRRVEIPPFGSAILKKKQMTMGLQ